MTHYHVISTKGLRVPIASVIYDDYEDSLLAYVALSNSLFGHMVEEGHLSVENAMKATDYGKAFGAYCGNSELTFVWMRCEGACGSATWN